MLQALLSFHEGTVLGDSPSGHVVHPSNASICARLIGMAPSTMRRHLACLVSSGLPRRGDSPHGKRYVRRGTGTPGASGFDLAPLTARHAEIAAPAAKARADTETIAAHRRAVGLMCRDLAELARLGLCERPDLPPVRSPLRSGHSVDAEEP